jgi:hypothetical protein
VGRAGAGTEGTGSLEPEQQQLCRPDSAESLTLVGFARGRPAQQLRLTTAADSRFRQQLGFALCSS